MTFQPPRCPYQICQQHHQPDRRFYTRFGSYQPRCRDVPVPRFRCRSCRRTFSRQTFRHDYGDRRPETNVQVFELLTSGVGLRQTARTLKLDPNSVQKKMRKMARTCQGLLGNLAPRLPADCSWLLDEEETFEAASIRPVTMPVLIEKETWFVAGTEVGPIRRLAPAGTARRRKQDREEARFGRRPDHSSRCVRKVLEQLAERVPDGGVTMITDQKPAYARICRAVFGDRVDHQTTSSTLFRGTFNPLFPINTTLAMSRDNNGRLRRKSWLVSKQGRYLHAQMQLFNVYRNFVRRRFNSDRAEQTPAFLLGLLPRQLHLFEVLDWRQDWESRSIHPMSGTAQTSVATKLPETP